MEQQEVEKWKKKSRRVLVWSDVHVDVKLRRYSWKSFSRASSEQRGMPQLWLHIIGCSTMGELQMKIIWITMGEGAALWS